MISTLALKTYHIYSHSYERNLQQT